MDVASQEFGFADWNDRCSTICLPSFQQQGGRSRFISFLLPKMLLEIDFFLTPSYFDPLTSAPQYNVSNVPGSNIEHGLASLTHYGLYAFMTIMPATG